MIVAVPKGMGQNPAYRPAFRLALQKSPRVTTRGLSCISRSLLRRHRVHLVIEELALFALGDAEASLFERIQELGFACQSAHPVVVGVVNIGVLANGDIKVN